MSVTPMTVGDLAEVASGNGAPQAMDAFGEQGHPFVRAGSLAKLIDGATESSLEKIAPDIAKRHRLRLFPTGTVVFAKSGMSAVKGHVYVLRSPSYVVSHLAALVPKSPDDSRFLAQALKYWPPARLIRDIAYPSIPLPAIAAMTVLGPTDIAERRRVAHVLDVAQALRETRRSAVDLLATLAREIFIEMFGHPVINEKVLPQKRLGELGKWASGGTPPRTRADYFAGDIPWFTSGELGPVFVSVSKESISAEALSRTSAKRVAVGALMLGMYDTAALKASLAAIACSCNQAVAFASIDVRLAEPLYVYYAIQIGRDEFRRQRRGIRQKNLNLDMVRSIQIPIPPLDQQRRFKALMVQLHGLVQASQAQLQRLDSLFTSIQARVFRAEL